MNESFNDMIHYDVEYEWTDSEADIAECTEFDTYYDEALNRYYYICEDYVRDGTDCYYRSKSAINAEENYFQNATKSLTKVDWMNIVDGDVFNGTTEDIFAVLLKSLNAFSLAH